ncbi:carbohydrate binding family 9 domain-containing protein [Gemmatimonadales bacterium]|nr:carbohydrate binding family 9 domain-containing protein [Gemmatimonadales bacterium]
MITSPLILALALQISSGLGDLNPETVISGQSSRSGIVDATEYNGSDRELAVPATKLESADISIDGRLDERAWSRAVLLTGFSQYEPVEGVTASEETTVRMLVTTDALYFAIRAEDSSGGIRATLTKRDGYGRSDDYVRVILDTFNDKRRAYVFMVNPFGVQGDGLWVEGGGGRFGDPIDWNPDFLWESDGRVDESGYSAEMKIPLKSLRFPESQVQDWGIQIQRTIRRTGYESSWAPITQEQANKLEQAGLITGLRELDAGLFLEINPTVVGTRTGERDPSGTGLLREAAQGEMGLNLTYGLTSNLTLDGTYNPDFSQIEADAGQIAVNERFALFLPEQRPFFLEGTDVFRMPKQLVYTRSIVNPVGAAKVAGKIGGLQVAYLGAVDEVNSGASNPIVNLVRVRGDVGRSSTIGAVFTDRTEPGADFNRVLGADARFVLGGRYTIQMLAAGSADGAAGADAKWGSMLSVSARRSSRHLSMNASFEDSSDEFRAGSGFIRRVGVTQVDGRVGYTFRGSRGSLVESWGPSFQADMTWLRENFWAGSAPQETELGAGLSASFRGNVGGFLNFRRRGFNLDPVLYDGLFSGSSENVVAPVSRARELYSGLYSVSLRSWISSFERVRISMGAGWNQTPIFSRGLPLDVGEQWSGDLSLTLYPTGAIQAVIGARHVSILRNLDGSTYSQATIPRLQVRYQLSKATYVRGIGEYSSQRRGSLLDPVTGEQVYTCTVEGCSARLGSDRHDFRLEGLLGFEPSPGTVVFFGYTRQFRDTSAFSFDEVQAVRDGLFLKLSYRFRR